MSSDLFVMCSGSNVVCSGVYVVCSGSCVVCSGLYVVCSGSCYVCSGSYVVFSGPCVRSATVAKLSLSITVKKILQVLPMFSSLFVCMSAKIHTA